jgi:asparagine synthase (glutamine-hydrolysing)
MRAAVRAAFAGRRMCGIAGIIGRIDEANRAALRRMSAAMVHRGPDGAGEWESAPDERGRGALLAHRRLAILDLSPSGAQPMVDPTTGDVVTFNGEIYDYVELRTRLEAAGHRFPSTGDTAVMLRALATAGEDALPSLRGMFAFAFWSATRRTLLLARDPLGMKPLYLARNPDRDGRWSLAFASEVRALLASGLLGNPRLDPRAVGSVVWNGFVAGPATAVDGVELLAPGRAVVFDGAGAEARTVHFWSAARPPPGRRARPVADESRLASVLQEDVRLHLASDVPLAVFLSGGVDSSVVANLACRAAAAPVHTFTLAFEEEALDEGPFARRIAEALGTQHQQVLLSEGEFVAGLDDALASLDQPTFDGLNSYYMSRAIRAAGFKVALVGTGGDELFGGYTSFRDLPVLLRWARRTSALPRGALRRTASALASALQPAGTFPGQTRWAKLPDMVERGDDLLALYQLAYALFLPGFQRELLTPDLLEALVDGLPRAHREGVAAEAAGRSPLSAIAVMELRLFLGERLLRDNDAASMAASIEQRLPLVDQVLFEEVDRLPDRLRFLPIRRKALLRRIGLSGLDPGLFARPKSGFVLPYDAWIRRRLGAVMDDTMRDPEAARSVGLRPQAVLRLWEAFLGGAPGVYWSRVWAIYVLIHWCRRHGVLR